MAKLTWDDSLTLGAQKENLDDALNEILDTKPKDVDSELDSILGTDNVDDVLSELLENKEEKEEKKEEKLEVLTLDLGDVVNVKPKEDVEEEKAEPIEPEKVEPIEPEKVEEVKPKETEEATKEPSEEVDEVKTEDIPTEETKEEKTEEKPAENCPICGGKIDGKFCTKCRFRVGEKTRLEEESGSIEYILPDRIDATDAVLGNENIARFSNGKFKLIAMKPIEVKVIEVGELDASLLKTDHILKTQTLNADDYKEAIRYESVHKEDVKRIFGKSVEELNGLPVKRELTEETKALLKKVMSEAGISKVDGEVIEELSLMDNVTEKDILMSIIRHIQKG